jgi:hypothetical protein
MNRPLIAAEPESAFAAGWTITFARSVELGLNRRAATDWVGGFTAWLDELADGSIDGKALAPSQFSAFLDPFTNERTWGVSDGDGNYLGSVGDTIETASKDTLRACPVQAAQPARHGGTAGMCNAIVTRYLCPTITQRLSAANDDLDFHIWGEVA